MSDLSGDLRYAVRGLRRSPLFAIIAVLTLALGIGATTAIFTLIDQVVLRRLPVPDAGALVQIHQEGPHNGSNMGRWMNSYPMYMDFQQKGGPLAQVIARRNVSGVAGGGQPDRARRRRAGVRQLLQDAGGEVGGRAGLLFGGGRPRLQRPPRRGPRPRLLDEPLPERPEGGRPEDHRQQLSDDDRRRLGRRLLRPRSRPPRRTSACRS